MFSYAWDNRRESRTFYRVRHNGGTSRTSDTLFGGDDRVAALEAKFAVADCILSFGCFLSVGGWCRVIFEHRGLWAPVSWRQPRFIEPPKRHAEPYVIADIHKKLWEFLLSAEQIISENSRNHEIQLGLPTKHIPYSLADTFTLDYRTGLLIFFSAMHTIHLRVNN